MPTSMLASAASRTPTALRMSVWLLVLPLLAPLALLLWSWSQPQPQVWAHLREFVLWQISRDTGLLVILVGLFCTTLGVGLAWLSACCEFPGRRWLDIGLALPLALPGYVVAFAYVGLLDYAGPVQTLWRDLSGSRAALPDIRNVFGAAVLLSLVLYPYVYLLVRAALLRRGAAAFQAARSLGRGPLAAFLQVALPLARPALVAGLALALLETLADFGAVSILGVNTFTTAIYRTWFSMFSLPAAAQLATGLLATIALLLLLERLLRGGARYAEGSARPMARLQLSGIAAMAAALLQLLVLTLGFLLPVAVLVWWVVDVEVDIHLLAQLAMRSVTVAGLVTAAVLLPALVLALAAWRAPRDRLIAMPVFIANLGYAVPGTVLAVAVMLLLVAIDQRIEGVTGWHLGLSASLFGMVLALSIRFLRIGYGAIDAGLQQVRPSLVESAQALGAGRGARLRRVMLPLLQPSLFSAALLLMVETMKEMPASLMLRPLGWDTLAVRIHGYTSEGLWAEAAAPALLLALAGLLSLLLIWRSEAR